MMGNSGSMSLPVSSIAIACGLLVAAACGFTPGARPGHSTSDAPGAVGSGSDATSGTTGSDASGCAGRVCVDATHSGSCDGTGEIVTDRDCPPASMCTGGYCRPPAGAAPCTTDAQCTGSDVCDLYVQGGMLVGYCTGQFGMDGTYQSCQSNDQCQTGLCADSGQCYTACTGTGQGTCRSGPDSIDCTSLDVTVEGVTSTGLSTCVGHD